LPLIHELRDVIEPRGLVVAPGVAGGIVVDDLVLLVGREDGRGLELRPLGEEQFMVDGSAADVHHPMHTRVLEPRHGLRRERAALDEIEARVEHQPHVFLVHQAVIQAPPYAPRRGPWRRIGREFPVRLSRWQRNDGGQSESQATQTMAWALHGQWH